MNERVGSRRARRPRAAAITPRNASRRALVVGDGAAPPRARTSPRGQEPARFRGPVASPRRARGANVPSVAGAVRGRRTRPEERPIAALHAARLDSHPLENARARGERGFPPLAATATETPRASSEPGFEETCPSTRERRRRTRRTFRALVWKNARPARAAAAGVLELGVPVAFVLRCSACPGMLGATSCGALSVERRAPTCACSCVVRMSARAEAQTLAARDARGERDPSRGGHARRRPRRAGRHRAIRGWYRAQTKLLKRRGDLNNACLRRLSRSRNRTAKRLDDGGPRRRPAGTGPPARVARSRRPIRPSEAAIRPRFGPVRARKRLPRSDPIACARPSPPLAPPCRPADRREPLFALAAELRAFRSTARRRADCGVSRRVRRAWSSVATAEDPHFLARSPPSVRPPFEPTLASLAMDAGDGGRFGMPPA